MFTASQRFGFCELRIKCTVKVKQWLLVDSFSSLPAATRLQLCTLIPTKIWGYLATCRSLVHLLVRWQLPKKETERETLEVHLFCSFLKNNSPQ